MANIHEHAVLTDILEPAGSGFVGRHGEDFALANNAQWIGFSAEIGPEGAVYILDWHDADICGKDVLHKETGRIFRFTPKESKAVDFPNRYVDLTTLSDLELAQLQESPSEWHARRARTILQHRGTSRRIAADAVTMLQGLFQQGNIDNRLRAMWALQVTGNLSREQAMQSLNDKDQYVRAWGIQLLCEDALGTKDIYEQLLQMATSDESPVVRLYLAAAMQRVEYTTALPLVEALSQHAEDNGDHNIPKMLWFGLEPYVTRYPERALKLAENSKIDLLSRHIARRLADDEKFEMLVAAIADAKAHQQDMLLGLRDGLDGRYDIKAPANWAAAYNKLRANGGEVSRIALQLSQQFGDTVAATAMLTTLKDSAANVNDRREALQGLVGRKRPEVKTELTALLDDAELRRDAIRAVAAFDDDALADTLLKRYSGFSEEEKLDVVQTLSARAGSGWKLTQAIKDGSVPRRDVPAYVARLLRRVVGVGFVEVWGSVDELSVDKEAQLAKYQTLLTADAICKASAENGRMLFNRTCGACHKMFGHGGNIGPDITGANRSSLEYLLGNILTPSAIIQDAYKMHIVLTDDGRVYSGIPTEENDRVVKLRIANRPEPVSISKSSIESREVAPVSMMPEGILSTMTDAEVLDLMAYLQSQKQVDFPSTVGD